MAPEVIDLTVEEKPGDLLKDLRDAASRAEGAGARLQQHLHSPKPAKKSRQGSSSRTPQRPLHQTRTKSCDDLIPVSLRKEFDRCRDDLIDPSLRSPLPSRDGAGRSSAEQSVSTRGRSHNNVLSLDAETSSGRSTSAAISKSKLPGEASRAQTSTSNAGNSVTNRNSSVDVRSLRPLYPKSPKNNPRSSSGSSAAVKNGIVPNERRAQALKNAMSTSIVVDQGSDARSGIPLAGSSSSSALPPSTYINQPSPTPRMVTEDGDLSRHKDIPIAHSPPPTRPASERRTSLGLRTSRLSTSSDDVLFMSEAYRSSSVGSKPLGPQTPATEASVDQLEAASVDHAKRSPNHEDQAGASTPARYDSSIIEGQSDMSFEVATGSSFPPGFDRGRFPKERRRRYGKNNGAPRINGFTKAQPKIAPCHTTNDVESVAGTRVVTSLSEQRSASRANTLPNDCIIGAQCATMKHVSSSTPTNTYARQWATLRLGDSSQNQSHPSSQTFKSMVNQISVPQLLDTQIQHRAEDSSSTSREPSKRTGQIKQRDDTSSISVKSSRQLNQPAFGSEPRDMRWSSGDREGVIDFFVTNVAATVKKRAQRYLYLLSEAERTAIDKSIVNDAMDGGLLRFLQKINFATTKSQRQHIRRYFRGLYSSRVGTIEKRREASDPSLRFKKHTIPWTELAEGTSQLDLIWLEEETAAAAVSTDHSTGSRDFWDDGKSDTPRNLDGEAGTAHDVPALSRELRYQSAMGSNFGLDKRRQRVPARQSRALLDPPDIFPRLPKTLVPPPSHLLDAHERQSRIPSIRQTRENVSPNIYASTPLETQRKDERGIQGPKLVSLRDKKTFDVRNESLPMHHAVPKSVIAEPASSIPRHVRHPGTFGSPYLEHEMAKAALTASSRIGHQGHGLRRIEITEEDQEQLLGTNHVSRSVTRGSNEQAKVMTVIQGQKVDPVVKTGSRLQSLLRHRELDSGAKRMQASGLQLRVLEGLRPWRAWKGASSDIVTVAWSPDSNRYAVGAAAHTNTEDLQYNRPCNLMLGNLEANKLLELPDHRTARPSPESIVQGPNSSAETYNACDPMVYQTVNSIAFSRSGKRMYSASRDETVKVWDSDNENGITSKQSLDHGAVVIGLDVQPSADDGLFATACQSIHDAIRVYRDVGSDVTFCGGFSSSRAKAKPQRRLLPECVRWGQATQDRHLLLAGFSHWGHGGDNEIAREGHLCLWDVKHGQDVKISPSSQSVSSIAWHPSRSLFVTGGAPSSGLRSRVRSVIRTYDVRFLSHFVREFESSAIDIQDVTYHPHDEYIVTAGCTDGTTLVWDYRQPDQPLHCLRHGRPLMELDPDRPRAETDTGVRLSLWGPEGRLYYSGSSDGVVKAWDIRRHPADVLVRDVAHLGAAIQDGAFSPDFSHLLVGDADGGIHMLSSAPCGSSMVEDSDGESADEEQIQLIRAPDGSGKRLDPDDDDPGIEGIKEAKRLVESGQIQIHPIYGPGKGSQYTGPMAKDDQRLPGGQSFSEETNRKQVFDHWGDWNEPLDRERKAFAGMRKSLFSERTGATVPDQGENVHASNAPMAFQPWGKAQHKSRLTAAAPFGQEAKGTFGLTAGRGKAHRSADKKGLGGALDNTIPDAKMVEENFWWPHLGETEIMKALGRC